MGRGHRRVRKAATFALPPPLSGGRYYRIGQRKNTPQARLTAPVTPSMMRLNAQQRAANELSQNGPGARHAARGGRIDHTHSVGNEPDSRPHEGGNKRCPERKRNRRQEGGRPARPRTEGASYVTAAAQKIPIVEGGFDFNVRLALSRSSRESLPGAGRPGDWDYRGCKGRQRCRWPRSSAPPHSAWLYVA